MALCSEIICVAPKGRRRERSRLRREIRSRDGAEGNVYEILIGIMEGSYFPWEFAALGCSNDINKSRTE
jgi:hypothetical protein